MKKMTRQEIDVFNAKIRRQNAKAQFLNFLYRLFIRRGVWAQWAVVASFIFVIFTLTSCADIEKAAEADASSDAVTVTVSTEPATEAPAEPDATTDTTSDTPAETEETGEIAVVVTFEPYTPPDPPAPLDPPVTIEIIATAEIEITEPDEETPVIIIDATVDIAVIIDTPEPDPTTDTPPPIFTPLFIIVAGEEIYLSGTTEQQHLGTGKIDKAGPGLFVLNDTLIDLTTPTAPTITTLDHTPTRARHTDTGLYSCIEYDPTTAAAMGGMSRFYSEFFLDGQSLGAFWENETTCRDIVTADDRTFIISEAGGYMQISGPDTVPIYILDGQLLIHNKDTVTGTLEFNQFTENLGMNFLTAAKQWQFLPSGDGGKFYSETGYIWGEIEGLQHLATAMQDFNTAPSPANTQFGQLPVLISAGVRNGLLYWIEGNTGHVVSYDTSTDVVELPHRLYTGDGMHATGANHRLTLQPRIIENYIYFTEGEILKRLDLETGFFSQIVAGVTRIFLID